MHSMIAQHDARVELTRGRTVFWSVVALGIGFVLGAGVDRGVPEGFQPQVEPTVSTQQVEDWHGNVKRSDWPHRQ
ncbi:MAG: hypothetical protein AB3N15_10825 [Paracoccaceae bacterium]